MPRKDQRRWVYSPSRVKKPEVPEAEKKQINEQCQNFINSELKSRYIHTNPQKNQRIITDIYGKWYRSFYYLCCTYYFNSPTLSDETIDEKFTRLEYLAPDTFKLAYMRHTGKWWEVESGLSLERTLETIKNNEIFHP